MLLTTPIPHTEAADLVRGKLPVTRRIFDALTPELRAAALVITGVEDLRAIERVRNITAGIPEGGDWDEAKKQILAELTPWIDDEEAAERRAELLLRSHAYAAYSTANYRALEEQKDIFTWRKYQTAQDERVRGTHAALDGIIAPSNSPFWRDHTPPWDFGCRCDIVGLTDDDVEELRQTGSQILTDDGKPGIKIIEPGTDELDALEQGHLFRDQTMHFVARDPDHYIFDPEAPLITIAMLEQMKQRVGPKAWAAFQDWARDAEVPGVGPVWDWLNGQPKARATAPAKKAAPAKKTPAKLARHRQQHPPVAAAFPTQGDAAVEPVKTALAAIETVHGDGSLPPIRVTAMPANANPGLKGKFVRLAKKDAFGNLSDWKVDRISINMRGSTKELTAVHEIGHFLASFGLGTGEDVFETGFRDKNTAIGKWWQAVSSTPSFKAIDGGPWDRKHASYLKQPDEAFARSYAQYIAIRGEGTEVSRLRAQVSNIRNSRRAVTQWDDAEFAPVAEALDAIFKEKGWLRPKS